MKLKSLCTRKEMVSKMKRLPTEWENNFASYTSDKGLIIRTYRELKKLNSHKINDSIKKWANELNRHFSKEEVQMAKKTHEEMLNIPGHKGKETKTMLKLCLTPVKIATIKNTNKREDPRW
jgi:hypothetical protein